MSAPLPRTALLAGATGLIGRQLLLQLIDEPAYGRLYLLLRRDVADLPSSRKLTTRSVDFAALPPMPRVDDVYIALGTTIKTAGSEEAFRRVDFDAVVAVARAAREAGATRLAVVSALGADARSRVFYNRVKGEMEQAVRMLGYETVVFARPSLLAGDRGALGQAVRPGEQFGLRWFGPQGPLRSLVPRGLRPIADADVAAALRHALLAGRPGVQTLGSGAMQGATRS